MNSKPHYTTALTENIQQVSIQAEQLFGQLSYAQLNWKPADNKWSVAQCLDHIMVSNSTYFPEFDRILSGGAFTNFWGKVPFLPALFGKMLLKSVNPNSQLPLKAPGNFTPSASTLPPTLLSDFAMHQQKLTDYYLRLQQVPAHHKIMLTSPAAKFVTYSLWYGLNIIALHEQRHLQQAKRVTDMSGFPQQ